MAVTRQASGTLLGATGTQDVTPVIPAHAIDDILILVTANRVITNTCATPAGWTLLFGPVDETAWRSYVFYRRATATNTTNPLCDWTATSADKYAQVHTLRGAINTGSPFAASAWTDGATDPAVCTGVTTTSPNQYVCVLGLQADNLAAVTSFTATNPASFTERSDTTITTGADAGGFFADAVRTTAGATGNVSVDFSAAPLHWGILVAAISEQATQVTKTQAALWNVKASVSKTVAQTWAVRTSVSPQTTAQSWAVRAQVTKTVAETWNVTGRISQTSAQSWAVKTIVAPKTVAETWAVRELANQNTVQTWAVRAQALKSVAEAWSVRQAVAKTTAEAWAVQAQITKTVASAWNVRSIVAASSAQLWNVLTSGEVSSASIQTWNVRALATQSTSQGWNVQTGLVATSVQSWGVKTTAGPKTVAESWAVARRITMTHVNNWNVLVQFIGPGGDSWVGSTTAGEPRWSPNDETVEPRWLSSSGAGRWSVTGG